MVGSSRGFAIIRVSRKKMCYFELLKAHHVININKNRLDVIFTHKSLNPKFLRGNWLKQLNHNKVFTDKNNMIGFFNN